MGIAVIFELNDRRVVGQGRMDTLIIYFLKDGYLTHSIVRNNVLNLKIEGVKVKVKRGLKFT